MKGCITEGRSVDGEGPRARQRGAVLAHVVEGLRALEIGEGRGG